MENRLSGKLALITGASAGIGEATAYKLASFGTNLILTARRLDKIESIAKDIRSKYKVSVDIFQFDVRRRDEVKQFADSLATKGLNPDFLINNAGLSAGKDPFFSADINDWELMIDTNIKGLLYVSRAIAPIMIKRNSGHIINIGSIAGEEPYAGGNVYNATKFAVRGLTQAMGIDLVDTNVKVTNVAPGMVNTEFSTVRFKGDKQKADKVYDGLQPLIAEDIADSIAYVLNTPPHVDIQYIKVTPTAQRSIGYVKRS